MWLVSWKRGLLRAILLGSLLSSVPASGQLSQAVRDDLQRKGQRLFGAEVPPQDLSQGFADIEADKQELYKRIFRQRTKFETLPDSRISERLNTDGAPIRSYAVIMGISEYPNFDKPGQHLAAAEEDLDRLEKFLRKQAFDEIILLKNADVTPDNIYEVLVTYLPHQLGTFRGGRVLITYTGHGAPGRRDDAPGFLVLGTAKNDTGDDQHFYPLAELEKKLTRLASESFHFLALVNSCNSGGVFYDAVGFGGNEFLTNQKGAYAMTATRPNELAYSHPKKKGSIFFSTIIDGVESGDADEKAVSYANDQNGNIKVLYGGIIRFGRLANHLNDKIVELGPNPENKKQPYSTPIWGSILPRASSNGAFFFLGPPQQSVTKAYELTGLSEPKIIGSGFVGLPGYKVFRPPDTYKILGLDVSSRNREGAEGGRIQWPVVEKMPKLRFVYIRATDSHSNRDADFESNWEGSRAVKLRHGAYYMYDFEKTAEQQFETVRRFIPRDADALPMAIDPEMYPTAHLDKERKAAVGAEILKLKKFCTEWTGKPAFIYGNSLYFRDFPETVEKGDAVWLAQFRVKDRALPPALPGTEPWTLWQFEGEVQVDGVPGKTDWNAFFGTEDDFADFANGKPGVAARHINLPR